MSESWLLDRTLPSNQRRLPTQATPFASSSLASSSASYLAFDNGDQQLHLQFMTGGAPGNHHALVDSDKSALGIEHERRSAHLTYSKPSINALTVPNVDVLDRKSILRS